MFAEKLAVNSRRSGGEVYLPACSAGGCLFGTCTGHDVPLTLLMLQPPSLPWIYCTEIIEITGKYCLCGPMVHPLAYLQWKTGIQEEHTIV